MKRAYAYTGVPVHQLIDPMASKSISLASLFTYVPAHAACDDGPIAAKYSQGHDGVVKIWDHDNLRGLCS